MISMISRVSRIDRTTGASIVRTRLQRFDAARVGGRRSIGRAAAVGLAASVLTLAAAANASVTFTNYTTTSGLGSNTVRGVFLDGTTIYAATDGGVSVSSDSGGSWTNYSGNGLGGGSPSGVNGVWASGNTIYAATGRNAGGLSPGFSRTTNVGSGWTNQSQAGWWVMGVWASSDMQTVYTATWGGGVFTSTDGGLSFTQRNSGTVLNDNSGGNIVRGIYGGSGSTIYAATDAGLRVSTDGGSSWSTALAGRVNGVFETGGTIYAASDAGGVSVSTNGGSSWTSYTTADGVGSNTVNGIYAAGSMIYAATANGVSVFDGTSWTNYTTGLGSTTVYGISAVGNTIYAATSGGLSIGIVTAAVPGTGVAGLAALGLVGLARRRRH